MVIEIKCTFRRNVDALKPCLGWHRNSSGCCEHAGTNSEVVHLDKAGSKCPPPCIAQKRCAIQTLQSVQQVCFDQYALPGASTLEQNLMKLSI
jgi:hypothetical protein